MRNPKTKAIFLMLVSSLSFSVMQIFVKLSSEEVGTFEQTFFRNLVSLIIAAVMVRQEKLPGIPRDEKGGWALWGRSFFRLFGRGAVLLCRRKRPAGGRGHAHPGGAVFVTLFAGLFLKENITPVKIASTVLCLVGAYIAMQPSFDSNPFPLLGGADGRRGLRHGLHHALLLQAIWWDPPSSSSTFPP